MYQITVEYLSSCPSFPYEILQDESILFSLLSSIPYSYCYYQAYKKNKDTILLLISTIQFIFEEDMTYENILYTIRKDMSFLPFPKDVLHIIHDYVYQFK